LGFSNKFSSVNYAPVKQQSSSPNFLKDHPPNVEWKSNVGCIPSMARYSTTTNSTGYQLYTIYGCL
jgi:hypothetical protein